ncbi:MAG: STAS domain-containing protein [Bacteroidetes bacterium]|nr:STAS domain-containing protein [Bacteroidota bacterium]
MEIRRSGAGRAVTVHVSGKMDAYWSDALSRELESCVSEGAREISLDLSEVSFISSAGLRVLLIYLKQMKAIKGRLQFLNPSEKVRSIFDLSGLTHLLTAAMGGGPVDAVIPATPLPDHTGMYTIVPMKAADPGVVTEYAAEDSAEGKTYPQVRYPSTRMGFGIGVFGDTAGDADPPFGEYLAAAGITVCVPTDERNHPDYMIEDGVFVPVISVFSGIAVDAEFNKQLNFEAAEQYRGIPFSSLALLALQEAATPAAAVLIIAESASLIGAQRKRSPTQDADTFTVHDAREQFSFTTEPSHERSIAVICGLVSHQPAPLLRPLDPAPTCYGHAHAAVFSHKPLPDGEIDAQSFIRTLFDFGTVHSVLHLMYDDRNPMRSTESEFVRGSMWVHPLMALTDRTAGEGGGAC